MLKRVTWASAEGERTLAGEGGKTRSICHLNAAPIKATFKALQLSIHPHLLDFWCCLLEPVYFQTGMWSPLVSWSRPPLVATDEINMQLKPSFSQG